MELLNRIGETPLLFCISGVPEDQTDYPGKTFFLRLWCVTTDWLDWGNPVATLGASPEESRTIQKWPKDSNPRPQWCFSHLKQVADFDYGSYGWVCIYSTMYPRELRSKVSEWTCPIFFFRKKSRELLANYSRTCREQLFFLMGGLRRVQIGGLGLGMGDRWV